MTQKIVKVGSSAAVIIPKKSLETLGVKVGDPVSVEVNRIRRAVAVKPAVRVDRELIEWTEKFISRYRKALEALAKK